MAAIQSVTVPVTVTLENYDELLRLYHALGNVLMAFRPVDYTIAD